ncbi:MAG: arsenate reductase family protein [Flavobacteriales bacterium]
MGVLAINNRELVYIYSDQSDLGKKILAYAQSNDKPIRAINIEKEKISDTVWLEIADLVDKPLSELFSPELASKLGIKNLSDYETDDLLKIVNKNPSLLQHPIAINGRKAISIKDRFDFFPFYKKDGSNFDKSPEAIRNGEHTDTTRDKGMDNHIDSKDA